MSKNRKGAGAPIGNKNALVWTREKADDVFERALGLANMQEERIIKDKAGNVLGKELCYKYDFIGELIPDLGLFRDVFMNHLPRQHPHLKEKVAELKALMERNCYANTKKGLIREAIGIVNLKSNHKWTDRQDTTSGDKPIEPNKVTISFKS